ncbi:hypothetical protein EV643_101685 [Kribbella sp. VKM Ac-2527]|uniref:DUF4352 domain-containing protein n=1 Tax=Kribbella caucasensis TaxID=2512215 RepID=A0A4R6KRS0_9ACTN|nr:hypothetical protein [Kribbella sp. VKM Ac-2527]TDO54894.1 hypothetical protein EV643_101685 [Kribbella sp. VKM Ac-2527]
MKLYRPATVVIGVIFVLLGGLTRLGEPEQVFDKQDRVVTSGTIGEELEYGDSKLTITRMRFVKSFQADESDDKMVQTKGIFVAIEYDAVRGGKDPGTNSVMLRADGGSVYEPVTEVIGDSVSFPEPGFAQTGAFVFEVNPADVTGLTFYLKRTQFFNSLAQDLSIDLAVPSEEIAQRSIDGAADEYVMPDETTRVAE